MKKVLILSGPNLNLLERRDKSIYGDCSLEKAEKDCLTLAKELGLKIEFLQSNSEGDIVNIIQDSLDHFDGLIINAAGYTHTSVAIRDVVEIFAGPKIELHISNIFKRETFRQHSFLSGVCDAIISGLGINGYCVALLAINNMIK